MPKKYCKWLLKNTPGGCSFTSGQFRVPLCTPHCGFCPWCTVHVGLLQGNWVLEPPLSTSSHRGCSALAGMEWRYLSVTHQGTLPSQGAVSLLSRVLAEDKQGHLLTSLLLPRQVLFPSIKTIIGRYFLTAQQVGNRTREELPLHGIPQILKHPFLIELFISSPASPDVPLLPASLTSSGVKWQVQIETC